MDSTTTLYPLSRARGILQGQYSRSVAAKMLFNARFCGPQRDGLTVVTWVPRYEAYAIEDDLSQPCVICGESTTSTRPASIGDRTGVACGDCAYWCDGNLTDVSGVAGAGGLVYSDADPGL